MMDLKAVLNELRRLVRGKQTGGFLVVSFGDHYVQFLKNRSKSVLFCEAVSNTFLRPKVQLDSEAIERLLSLGFKKPDSDKRPNFYKIYNLDEAERYLPEISALAVQIMAEVYDIGKNAKLDIKFVPED